MSSEWNFGQGWEPGSGNRPTAGFSLADLGVVLFIGAALGGVALAYHLAGWW